MAIAAMSRLPSLSVSWARWSSVDCGVDFWSLVFWACESCIPGETRSFILGIYLLSCLISLYVYPLSVFSLLGMFCTIGRSPRVRLQPGFRFLHSSIKGHFSSMPSASSQDTYGQKSSFDYPFHIETEDLARIPKSRSSLEDSTTSSL